jgi:hypothetical protein
VRRTDFVDEHAELRILADQRAGGAGVIEVDMRQQNRRHVGEPDAGGGEMLMQCRQGARRAGIDDGDAGRPVQNRAGNHARTILKMEVEVRHADGEGLHQHIITKRFRRVPGDLKRRARRGAA